MKEKIDGDSIRTRCEDSHETICEGSSWSLAHPNDHDHEEDPIDNCEGERLSGADVGS